MIKTMVAYKIRVWYNLRNKSYKIRIENIELKITPHIVYTNDNIVTVGQAARQLYNALLTHDKEKLREIIPTITYIASLLQS